MRRCMASWRPCSGSCSKATLPSFVFSSVRSSPEISMKADTLLAALNDGHPGLNLGEDAIDSLEGVFARMRSIVLCTSPFLPRGDQLTRS